MIHKSIWIAIKRWKYHPQIARKSRQMLFATNQRMFGVFAIDEILCYRGSPFPASRTLCHPAWYIIIIIKGELQGGGWLSWDQKNHHHDHPHPWYIIIIIRGELEGAGWLHCDWHPERSVPLSTEGWRSLPGVRRSVLDRQHRGNPIQSNPIQSNPMTTTSYWPGRQEQRASEPSWRERVPWARRQW